MKKAMQAAMDAGALGIKVRYLDVSAVLKLHELNGIKKEALLFIHCAQTLIMRRDAQKQLWKHRCKSMDQPRGEPQ